jgi:membrane associated rhomboid family serine protease
VDCGINLTTGRPLLMTDDEKLDQIYMYAERAIRWISWLIPWGVYPIASEAFGMRKPWVARGVAVLTILVSAWFMAVFIYNPDPGDPGLVNLMLWSGEPLDLRAELRQEGVSEADIEEYLRDAPPLGEFQPRQLFTHALLHDGVLHLAGNLLFLMVFGTRVKALIGNILTALVYPLLAVIAGVFHMVSNAHAPAAPMLGASGAIMGLAGMYFVLAPVHQVHVAAWWRWGLVRGFQLSLKLFTRRGFWVVLFYIAFDVAFTIWRIDDDVAHWAHLGGFLGGAALATLLLSARLVNARGGDVFTAVFGRHAWVLIGRPNRPGLTLP